MGLAQQCQLTRTQKNAPVIGGVGQTNKQIERTKHSHGNQRKFLLEN